MAGIEASGWVNFSDSLNRTILPRLMNNPLAEVPNFKTNVIYNGQFDPDILILADVKGTVSKDFSPIISTTASPGPCRRS